MALHEQVNILQTAIYNDLSMQAALRTNQFSWATNFPTGVAAEIELTLSAECRAKTDSLNVWFSKRKTAKLYDQDQRMTFVYAAANRFDALLNSAIGTTVEASISEIATYGGAK